MESAAAYLAFLSWKDCPPSLEDYSRLKQAGRIQKPERLQDLVSHKGARAFFRQNPNWLREADALFAHCRAKGYRLSFLGEPSYPKAFSSLDFPPLLSYKGCLPGEGDLAVTVAGSRKPAEVTLNWMDFFLPRLVQDQKVWLVSGGARGVDQKAHSIAVRLQAPTVCFLPSGLDCFYPASLYRMEKAVLDCGGAFVSCFPPDFQMKKFCFHIRNRLMARFSSLVVIMQAEIRSGTMLTARYAVDFDIPTATLPGPPLSPLFAGNLQLLFDGAFLLRDGLDLSLLMESARRRP